MTKKLLLVFFSLVFILNTAYSNGGPIDMSHFRKTGNIRLLQKANVSLLKENLQLKVVGDYTEVNVEYTLRNNGDAQKVQYGFPVDVYESNWSYGDYYSVFDKNNDCLASFEALENGSQVKINQWIIDSVYLAKSVNINEGKYRNNQDFTILRKWSAMTLKFEKNEIKQLNIQYKIKNTLRDKMPGFHSLPRFTDRHFTYHLTPSSRWGDGIINDFTLEIDLGNLAQNGSSYNISSIDGLAKNGNIFTFSAKNYDLNTSDRINIHYNNTHVPMAEFITKYKVDDEVIKSITSLTNQSTVHNILDNDVTTTWTGKKNDWIELEFQKSPQTNHGKLKSISGILLLNGNYSSLEDYRTSGKASKLRVIINDTILYNTEPWEGEAGSRIIRVEPPVYRDIDTKLVNGLATIIADGDILLKTDIDKIRIEILETNSNLENTCSISELIIVGL